MYTRYPQQPKQLQSKSAGPNTRCQKCLKFGHHTYECSNARPYQARPSRTQQLEKGKLGRDQPSVQVPEKFKKDARVGLADKILQAKEDERKRLQAIEDKKAGKGKSKSSSRKRDTSSSDSDSDSDSDFGSISSSSSSSRAPRRRRRYSSSSSSSGSDDDRSPPPPRRRRRSPSDSRSPPPRRRDSPARDVETTRRRSRSPVRRPAGGSRSPVKRVRDERE